MEGRATPVMTFPGEPPLPAVIPPIKVVWSSPLDLVRETVIKDQADLTAADMIRREILEDIKRIEAVFRPLIDEAHAHHKALLAKMKEFTDPRQQALDILKPKIGAYLDEQDRVRLQAEREAELKRQEAQRLQEKAVDKAWMLTDKGQAGKAEQVLKEAITKAEEIQAAAPAIPEKPVAGVVLRELWDFEIVDLDKLKKEAPEYVVPNEAAIRKHGQNLKDQARIPGVRFFKKTTVADKGRRS